MKLSDLDLDRLNMENRSLNIVKSAWKQIADRFPQFSEFGVEAQMREVGHLIDQLRTELAAAREALETVLRENAHLADGDNCTLAPVKRALATISGKK